MSKRQTTLKPGSDRTYDGSRVVYAASREGVRSAVVEPCAVVLLDGTMVRAQPDALRWLVTMTAETVVAVVGDAPDHLTDIADTQLAPPVSASTAETLTRRLDNRRAYLDAVERYYRATEDGTSGPAFDAARTATEEHASGLDAADRRAILDAIDG